MHEIKYEKTSLAIGLTVTLTLLALAVGSIFLIITTALEPLAALTAILFAAFGFSFNGFYINQPNEAKVFTLFGKYKGTSRRTGINYVNPFYLKRRISLRIRNFNVDKIKVNDALGNPIEISSIVVWKVDDTYEAMYEVEDYEQYVSNQSESALRELAGMYPYDLFDDVTEDVITLRDNNDEVNEKLKESVQKRLDKVGVEVLEVRLNHIAYAQEIAAAMLQRQQASAIIAARKIIVEGAVSMVEMALKELNHKKIVNLSDKSKAEIVGNLLVVLCGDKNDQPVITTNKDYN